jgi:orotidine-5'-phosphate decarboxylase
MKPLIIALDVETDKEALSLLKATRQHCDLYKIGPGHLLRYGPQIIKKIRAAGKKVFLDLKFHDIPSTMARSIRETSKLGIYSATVHTSGGETALKEVAKVKGRPQVWGVTVLTSLSGSDLDQIGFERDPMDQAIRLAELAKRSAIDGIVASVGETATLRKIVGKNFTIVTPGIRLPDNAVGDQKRVATPAHARQAGSSFIVVGRPILEAKDPEAVAAAMMTDWKKGVA